MPGWSTLFLTAAYPAAAPSAPSSMPALLDCSPPRCPSGLYSDQAPPGGFLLCDDLPLVRMPPDRSLPERSPPDVSPSDRPPSDRSPPSRRGSPWVNVTARPNMITMT